MRGRETQRDGSRVGTMGTLVPSPQAVLPSCHSVSPSTASWFLRGPLNNVLKHESRKGTTPQSEIKQGSCVLLSLMGSTPHILETRGCERSRGGLQAKRQEGEDSFHEPFGDSKYGDREMLLR